MISRRSFIALASGLIVAEIEPVRAYSFIGGWREHHPYYFILEGAGWPKISVSVALDWIRQEGRDGILTQPENVIVERLWNADIYSPHRSIVRARIPAVDPPPRRQLDGRLTA